MSETPDTPELATPEVASAQSEAVSAKSSSQESASPEPASKASLKHTGRPFRVKLRGSVLLIMLLPNRRQLRGALHQLSTTGGTIHVEKPLDEKIEVELVFHLDRATIRGKAQMLFPMWATTGWMQPFRFVDLDNANRESLESSLQVLAGQAAKAAAAGA